MAARTTAVSAVVVADHVKAAVIDGRTIDKLVGANAGTELTGPVARHAAGAIDG